MHFNYKQKGLEGIIVCTSTGRSTERKKNRNAREWPSYGG